MLFLHQKMLNIILTQNIRITITLC